MNKRGGLGMSRHDLIMVRVPRMPPLTGAGRVMPVKFLPMRWREVGSIPGARPGDRFCAARINGDSLIKEGICDGDYVIVRLTFDDHEITPGALVAALTPVGLLVKHIYRAPGNLVCLASSNGDYKALSFDAEEVIVQGIVVGVDPDSNDSPEP